MKALIIFLAIALSACGNRSVTLPITPTPIDTVVIPLPIDTFPPHPVDTTNVMP